MSHFDSLYARLPVAGQNLAVSAYGYYWKQLRFGSGYARFLAGYLEREHYSVFEWDRLRREGLRRLIQEAHAHVPYYAERWSKAQVAEALNGDLNALPLLEKEPIRTNPDAFVRRDMLSRRLLTFHTSGTSGTPLATRWLISELRDSLAIREARSARWAGVSFSMPRATFSGRLVEPDPMSKGPFHRYNLAERQVYFSAFHLRPDTARYYIDALGRHDIRWLTGYAVSFYLLAKFALEQRIPVPPINAVITTSEKVTPQMRQVMEEAFGCKVYEEYSTVENSMFVSECGKGRLHVSPDAGIVEILRPDGSPCDPGEVGEVVATSLIRHAQPFIRFRLGDLAAWSGQECPCGRAMPVIEEVTGRMEDIVVGPDGRQMVRFHGIFVDQPHVREGQIVQETLQRIVAKVVPAPAFGVDDEGEIIRRIRQRLGPNINVVVQCVDHIPRTASGKFKAVISYVGSHKGRLKDVVNEPS